MFLLQIYRAMVGGELLQKVTKIPFYAIQKFVKRYYIYESNHKGQP